MGTAAGLQRQGALVVDVKVVAVEPVGQQRCGLGRWELGWRARWSRRILATSQAGHGRGPGDPRRGAKEGTTGRVVGAGHGGSGERWESQTGQTAARGRGWRPAVGLGGAISAGGDENRPEHFRGAAGALARSIRAMAATHTPRPAKDDAAWCFSS